MQYSVQVENTSPILRKLTIKVPAEAVAKSFEKGLAEAQRTAKIKGFRPGHVPITVIKQYYGADVRHQVFHNLINESYREALKDQKLRAVGSPNIDTSEHNHGQGAHDHGVKEGQDLTFVATVEVMPEIDVKSYTGIALTRSKSEVTEEDVQKIVTNMLDSQAQLVPVTGGLVGADGKPSSPRPVKKGDFVDMTFTGGIVTDQGVEPRDGMKGTRTLEVGSDSLIPGFEEHLVGMRTGETKTFRVPFPADFYEKDMAGKDSEFTVTVNDLKEKKHPELDDEFAKGLGYEGLSDLRTKGKEHLVREKTAEVERKLRSDLLQHLIEKNPFDVPVSLVQAQTRVLAQDVAGNLKQQGFTDPMIQEALAAELENLKKRAENQVRASLILESIAKKESVSVTQDEIKEELGRMAISMKVEEDRLHEFYTTNPDRREDLEYRMREDRAVKLLLDKAKVKDEK